jgi:hypothetical protein
MRKPFSASPHGPETGLEDIHRDVPEADFGPGITPV